jgi:hypothetical protein
MAAGGSTVPEPEALGPRIDTAPVPVIPGAPTVPVPAALGPAMVTAAVPLMVAGAETVPDPETTGPAMATWPVPVIPGAPTEPAPATCGPATVIAPVPVIPPPPPPAAAIRGTRPRSAMSVSDQGRAVAVGMVSGKVGIKAPLPRKVSFNGSAFLQGWRKKRNHHLCDLSSPTTVKFGSVSPYPNRSLTGTQWANVPPQKRRLDRRQRSYNRIIAIQKNRARAEPLVGRFGKKKVIIHGIRE